MIYDRQILIPRPRTVEYALVYVLDLESLTPNTYLCLNLGCSVYFSITTAVQNCSLTNALSTITQVPTTAGGQKCVI